MGLETSNQRVALDPRQLVTPRDRSVTSTPAVEALTGAYAKGFITTDDIMRRVGERGHKQAQVESATLDAQKQILEDPDQALAKQALSAQRAQLIEKAVKYGAPIPQKEDGTVDFQGLQNLAPQLDTLEKEEARKAALMSELDDAFKTARSSTSLNDIFIPSQGNRRVAPEEFNRLRRYAATPTRFSDMFGGQAGAAAPVGGAAAPGGEIIGSGTPVQPATAAAAPPTPAAAPQTAAADQGSFFPSDDATGKTPTEVQTKAYMAAGRFNETEPILEAIEESEYDLTGKGESAKRWLANIVPDWTPFVGHAALPNEAQLYEAAAKAWAQGLLRLESGAAITVKEEKSYIDTFLPRAGDSKEAVLFKRQMRRMMADSIAKIAAEIDFQRQRGNEAAAEELAREYEAARESAMLATQSALAQIDSGEEPDMSTFGIRPKGAEAPVSGDIQNTAVGRMPGFSGVDPNTGLPIFSNVVEPNTPQNRPLVEPR